ncbi:hypothetical protein BSKO_09391 [Bryopsis sp. KO-2023]|nr:hypothetical protein BSKO_09391 [Bryopsis sp. KO-2023]
MSHFWWPHSQEPDYEFTEGEPSEVAVTRSEEEEYITPGPLPRYGEQQGPVWGEGVLAGLQIFKLSHFLRSPREYTGHYRRSSKQLAACQWQANHGYFCDLSLSFQEAK